MVGCRIVKKIYVMKTLGPEPLGGMDGEFSRYMTKFAVGIRFDREAQLDTGRADFV